MFLPFFFLSSERKKAKGKKEQGKNGDAGCSEMKARQMVAKEEELQQKKKKELTRNEQDQKQELIRRIAVSESVA
jgi:hypothetical protein